MLGIFLKIVKDSSLGTKCIRVVTIQKYIKVFHSLPLHAPCSLLAFPPCHTCYQVSSSPHLHWRAGSKM